MTQEPLPPLPARPFGIGEDEGTRAIAMFDRFAAIFGSQNTELREGTIGLIVMANALGVAMDWTADEVQRLWREEDFRWLCRCMIDSYYQLVDSDQS